MVKRNCWMCEPHEYTYLEKSCTRRLLEDNEKDGYYVVVPRDPHVWCHIMVVLKKEHGGHGKGLAEATEDDLKKLIKPVIKWKDILIKSLGCNQVYLACLCDSKPDDRHLHYHLIPVDKKHKTYFGHGFQWLGCLEFQSERNSFKKCSPNEKKAKRKDIESMIEFLEKERDKNHTK